MTVTAMTERSSVNSPLGQDDREAPSHGTCFCYSGSTWLQTASKQLDASQTSGKEKSIDSRFLATSSYRTLQTPSLSFKTCSGHSMDPVKDKVSNFKDSDGYNSHARPCIRPRAQKHAGVVSCIACRRQSHICTRSLT